MDGAVGPLQTLIRIKGYRIMDRHMLLEALVEAESALGANLVWIQDRVGLSVRQGDAETLRRLAHLTHGWKMVCAALANADKEATP